MAASSLAWRTSSGVRLPVGAPRSTRATTAGCVSTSEGSNLRAFEDTNTSRNWLFRTTWARQSPESSRPRVHSATGGLRTGHSPCPARWPSSGNRIGGPGPGLLLLLVVADLLQRVAVHHVGHRAVAVLGVGAHGRLPALRAHAEPLGEQRHEDLRLLLAEPRQRHHPLEQLLAA